MGKMYRRWDKFEVQDVIARYLSGEDVQAIAEGTDDRFAA